MGIPLERTSPAPSVAQPALQLGLQAGWVQEREAVTPLSDEEIRQLRRMLVAFKADLPAHELGGWYVTSQPDETVIEDERNVLSVVFRMEDGRIVAGYATCQRCGKRFEIPRIGNFRTREGRLQETIAEAKEWVERDARSDGPCWGNVPRMRERSPEAFAVFDRA